MTRGRRLLAIVSAGVWAASVLACSPAERVESAAEPAPSRPVLPNDRGTLFASAADGENAFLGISLNDPHSVHWAQMSDAAVKVAHGMATVIRPSGESQWPWFPYRAFIEYEQREVAAGRPPLRLTATYQGVSRPVYLNWSLGFPAPGEPPRVPDPDDWEQAVNLADDRYTRWVLDNYVEPIVFHRYHTADGRPADLPGPHPNQWLGLDQITINQHLYGVLDDAGTWVPMDAGPIMDRPFPHGSAALHAMYRHFFARLHEMRPGLRVMVNAGSPDSWAAFRQDLADVDGLVIEELFAAVRDGLSPDGRQLLLDHWRAVSDFAADGGVVLMRSLLDPAAPTYESDLRSGLVAYLLLSGADTAWAPQGPGFMELPPEEYQAMKAAIGRATSTMEVRREGGRGAALYSRTTENGVVVVNATGRTVVVPCPEDASCRDRSGGAVDAIAVPDLTGDYLLTS
ncbi:hypothetical protein [Geodermatophilus sp. CPCC 206100]|uniref:hypothetical protein n=1 Tax=Geodermatophilus sp. CPCC 206100 TaxID=3020054 RepID=UPI003B001612